MAKIESGKLFTVDPKTGQSRIYDMDNPDAGMLKQMAEVLLRRLDMGKDTLTLLYINNEYAPQGLRQIVRDLVDGHITQEQAADLINTWVNSLT